MSQSLLNEVGELETKLDSLLESGEALRSCLDMNDQASVQETMASLSARLQHVSQLLHERETHAVAAKHEWHAFQVSAAPYNTSC